MPPEHLAEERVEQAIHGWVEAEPLPDPAQEIYPTTVGDSVVVVGGFGAGSAGALDKTWIFEDGSWSAGPSLPAPRHHMVTTARGDQVFAMGGYVIEGEAIWSMRSDVFVLEVDRSAWNEGPSLPTPRSEGAAGTVDGTIVLAAGRRPIGDETGERFHHMDARVTFRLDVDAETWREGADIPTPRNSCASAVLDGRLHVIGGRRMLEGDETGFAQENLDAHEAYDVETDTWGKLAPLPKAASGIAGVAHSGKIYVLGGEDIVEPFEVWRDVWVYDPESDSWQALAPLPSPRHGHGVVSLEGGVHLVGGSLTSGGTGTTGSHHLMAPAH